MRNRTKEIDMCNGSLTKNILLYSIPLMFTNVLQVLFNLADIAVVGKFAGARALGSVGSTTILVTLTTGLMIGMAGGVNAITALFMGAKDSDKVKKTVHTSILLCFITGLIILCCGLLFTRPILNLMNTKEELIDGASIYLKVYLCGSPALALYNYGNAVLSAIGDTKRPLKYLTISGIVNVILNLIFVVVFHMGVFGVALASIISQYISAYLILRCLFQCKEVYGLKLHEIRIDRKIAIRILRISIPSAIQYSVFAIANLFVQSAVNSFDHVVVEGNAAAANADAIVYDMMAAFYTASTSFIAQNYGARNKKRILHAYIITTIYSFTVAFLLGLALVVFHNQFLSLFTNDVNVVYHGTTRIMIMGLCYCVSAFMDNATAAARGIGKSMTPTVIVLLGSVAFRILWIVTIFAYYRTIKSLYLLYIFSWTITSIPGNIYFLWHYRKIKE
ncbi:MAG: MATE family efflux transporter [Clostridiales bacterium]|nr:MATE family efflux transporter [Clostridiales bacterium]